MFNLAIDNKLCGCDRVNLHVRDVTHGNPVLPRAMVVQCKSQRPVQFELTEPTRSVVLAWIELAKLGRTLFVPQSPGEIAFCFHSPLRSYRISVDCHWV
jgi:hypothetical protein